MKKIIILIAVVVLAFCLMKPADAGTVIETRIERRYIPVCATLNRTEAKKITTFIKSKGYEYSFLATQRGTELSVYGNDRILEILIEFDGEITIKKIEQKEKGEEIIEHIKKVINES